VPVLPLDETSPLVDSILQKITENEDSFPLLRRKIQKKFPKSESREKGRKSRKQDSRNEQRNEENNENKKSSL
jgi:hypothetical protein